MDQSSNFLQLGRVRCPHGLKGEVKVQSFTVSPLDFLLYKTLYSQEGKAFFIAKGRYAKNSLIIHFVGIDDQESAESLRGVKLFVDRSFLPPLEKEEFYPSDLLGLAVWDTVSKKIGHISGIFNFGAGDILEIFLDCDQKKIMIPFDRRFVIDVNINKKIVLIDSIAAGMGDV